MKRVFLSSVVVFFLSVPYLIGAVVFILFISQFASIDYYGIYDGFYINIVF